MRRLLVGFLTLFVLIGTAPRGMAATDKRELEAREFFGAGRYQEALDVFAKLYAEKLHPVYLRNIGRCYQNLSQPDRAISSFREYLRKMKHISADEHAEIDGYIHEMEDLQKRQSAAPPKGPVEPLPSSTPPPEPVRTSPLPVAPPPAATPSEPGTTALVASHAEPQSGPSSSDGPVYTRWWFWTVIGVVAVGGAIGAAAAVGAFKNSKDAACPTGAASCK